MPRRILLICLALFALNAFICAPLFGIEYLDDLQSNEGSWITFAKFLSQNWPHVSYFPWFNAGMPFEDTYLPGVSAIVAILSTVTHSSPAHAFHFVAALTYSFAPVSLFLFAFEVSGRLRPSMWAALLWSLLSPSVVFPAFFNDMGTVWGLKRLRNIVVYGETPHNVAICLLPISLLFIWRCLVKRSPGRFASAVLATAAVIVMNAFGIVVVFLSSMVLFATGKRLDWKSFATVGAVLTAAYLIVCRFLPPTLIRLLETNAQLVGGDYRFTLRTVTFACCSGALLAALWAATRRFSNPILQFAVLFTGCFGGITWLGFLGVNLLPQPERYHIEMEAGACLLTVFLLEQLVVGMRQRVVLVCTIICAASLGWIAVRDYQFAHKLIRAVDIERSVPFREARWSAANLPGQRILVSGEGQWLFNLFSDNPQMGAGHEPSAPNWVQRVAVYTIYSGRNAGEEDARISILWLKAFGCGGIVVPGRDSKDHYHAIANPDKFDGLLPLVWRESGDSIYQVPLRSTSLAHVIPKAAIVTSRPVHGLDVGELRRYVDALESASIPPASIAWRDPDHAKISAKIDSSQVVSIQMTYDSGWEARIGGRKVNTRADELGFIVVDSACSGDCSIDLAFTGGLERQVTLFISAFVMLVILVMFFWPLGADKPASPAPTF